MLAVGAAAAGLWVYRYDLYEKEPWWALLLAAACGALGMWLVGFLQEEISHRIGLGAIRFAVVASTTEEALKIACVFLIALLIPRVFNDPVDGVIYGSMAGFGCAVFETIAHFQEPMGRPWTLLPETTRLLGHLVFGGIAGVGVGFVMPGWKWKGRGRAYTLLGYTGAVLVHALWDVVAIGNLQIEKPTLATKIYQPSIMLLGLVFYGLALRTTWKEAERRSPSARCRIGPAYFSLTKRH